MAVERRPLTLLQTQQTDLKTQLSSIGKLQGYVAALRDKAQALSAPDLWAGTAATSADETAVKASSGPGAAAGTYSVAVESLASSQTISSRVYAAPTTPVGSGTLTIELGQWGAGTPASGFTPKADKPPLVLQVGPPEATLTAIRDQINNADYGVTATIVKDAQGSRLAIRSSETGEENGFRISATETSDDGVADTGLSALAYDAAAASSPMTRNQIAANAKATVNGIAVSSSTNTLEGVSDGVTLTLLKKTATGAAPTDVMIGAATDAVKTAIQDFVKAYNDVTAFIREQTKVDNIAKKGADSAAQGPPLAGDRTVISLQSQLRNVLNESSGASSVFSRLSDIGIAMKVDGTLETKTSKLDAGLANLPELKKLFAADNGNNANNGFMTRFKALADNALNTGGTFDTRNESLNARIARITQQQDQMNRRLDQTEARLTKQYQVLDEQMTRLNGLNNYVTQQLAALKFS